MTLNGLQVNPLKSELLIIPPNRQRDYVEQELKLKNATIKESKSVKVLGMRLTNDLGWTAHIDELHSKMSASSGIIYRLKSKLNSKQLSCITDALVISKLRYGLSLFSKPRLSTDEPKCMKLEKIQVLMNNLLRLISGVKREDKVPIIDLAKGHSWASLNQISISSVVSDTWRAINQDYGCADYYRRDYIRDTRASSRGEFKTDKHRTSPFVTAGVKMLNSDLMKERGYELMTVTLNP